MDTLQEPSRQTPVVADVDLCVIGGGVAGVFAAVAAARLGVTVALVERLGYFGGAATAGLVCVWHSSLETGFERVIVGGLPIELMDRLERRGAVSVQRGNPSSQYIFSPSEMILELDKTVSEVQGRIRPFLHARFVDVSLSTSGRAAAVIIEDKSGRRAVRSRVFVDASGDGDLVHRMGLPTYRRKRLQPPTTCALLQGLGDLRRSVPDFCLERIAFDPQYPEALRPGFLWHADLPHTDLTMVAGTRVHGADCSDADQLTRAELEGRRQVRSLLDLLHRRVDGGASVTLQGLPAQIGIRETRHASCLHRLAEREVLTGVRFPDAIANGSYRVDVHAAEGDGLTFRYLDGREVTVLADGRRRVGRWRPEGDADASFYQIPYSSLVPVGALNVLVAGRCLDADEGAFGAARVMINTSQMGQAVGVAACLALNAERDVADIEPRDLRRALSEQGAIVI
jgi:flavin-dependent dehydrogenase